MYKDIIIDDKYFIRVDEYNHTLLEKNTSKNKEGKLYDRPILHGHFNSVERALVKVVKLKTLEQSDNATIEEYLNILKKETQKVLMMQENVEYLKEVE